jgi:16S rRNA (uracil1498-N3)-methyltransferase
VLREAAAFVFVEDLSEPLLSCDDAHHLRRALRLRDGETVVAADGRGSYRECVLRSSSRQASSERRGRPGESQSSRSEPAEVYLEASAPIETEQRPAPPVAIGFALAKGLRPEWAVQKLTELGVDAILPLLSARTVVRPDDAGRVVRTARLVRVAREAAMQARQLFLPVIGEVTELSRLQELRESVGSLALPARTPRDRAVLRDGDLGRADLGRADLGRADLAGMAPTDLRAGAVQPADVVFAEPGGPPPEPFDRPLLILVGPEGGFEQGEIELGYTVGLGRGVLRTETAAVVAASLFLGLRDGLIRGRAPALAAPSTLA